MSDTQTLLIALVAPFEPHQISWRVGSTTKDKSKGMALAFIDARDVYKRLDDVVGTASWQCRYPHVDKKTVCEIGIKLDGEWVWKANGAGDSDIEAEKGALSDAVKRAAVVWGIGRYLYDLDSPWVQLDVSPDGRVKGIKQDELQRLQKLLGRQTVQPSAPAAEPVLTSADKAAKALVWAAGFVASLNDVEPIERTAHIKRFEAQLDAARAYPEARAILDKAAV